MKFFYFLATPQIMFIACGMNILCALIYAAQGSWLVLINIACALAVGYQGTLRLQEYYEDRFVAGVNAALETFEQKDNA